MTPAPPRLVDVVVVVGLATDEVDVVAFEVDVFVVEAWLSVVVVVTVDTFACGTTGAATTGAWILPAMPRNALLVDSEILALLSALAMATLALNAMPATLVRLGTSIEAQANALLCGGAAIP
jgi:hypothetical protein